MEFCRLIHRLPIHTSFVRMNQHLYNMKGYRQEQSWHKTDPFDYYGINRHRDVIINIWRGIHGSRLEGLVFLPDEVKATAYWREIKGKLSGFQGTLFQRSGVPARAAYVDIHWLVDQSPLKRIGLKRPIQWPPRSPVRVYTFQLLIRQKVITWTLPFTVHWHVIQCLQPAGWRVIWTTTMGTWGTYFT